MKKLLMISTDRNLFVENSDVKVRQIEYAKNYDEVHIVVFAPIGKFPQKINLSPNCFVYSTNSLIRAFYPGDAKRIGKKIIQKVKIDEITCQDASFTAIVGLSLGKIFSIPVELQLHGDISSPFFRKGIIGKWRYNLICKNLPRANKIRVVSQRIKDYIQNNFKIDFNKTQIEIRPIEVKVDEINNASIIVDIKNKYKQFDQVALMASRLEKEKNIKLAIESWIEVHKAFPKAGLIIVGKGSQEPLLKQIVVESGLAKSIVFEDWAEKNLIYSYMKTADIFLNTSLFEGYGMTLKEASIAKCNIVSTDVGIARDVGAVISTFDSHDLATKINSVFFRINKKHD